MKFLSKFKCVIDWIDKWLIHPNLKVSVLSLRKARLLVTIHLFLLFVAVLMDVFNTLFFPAENPPLKIGAFIVVVLILVFRKWGNLNLSGNLIAALLGSVLIPAVYETGGLYSDNLLWMMGVPLLSLLFSNRFFGFSWLVLLLAFTFHLFLLEKNALISYRHQTLHLDGLYFFITYCGLFVMIVGIVLIFATGQSLIIKALDAKQQELTIQKAELTRQTQSLIEAEAKILASNKELSQFASAAAHDLKEPLRMINMYTQLIKRKIGQESDAPTQEYMGFVTDGVLRMERLLTDLLEYSRLGRKDSKSTNVDLNDTLFVVINNLTATMKDTHAAILSNNLPVIKASTTEMMQLFQNLISNSIKFRQKGVDPVIEINHHVEEGSHLFSLRDNGIGIPEHAHSSVFNIFERLHSKEEYEGTGIGLATCKKIINNLGGEIWVQSAPDEGTVFCFTIPSQLN